MASTAGNSSNKWVKYCVDHAAEMSSYVKSLEEDEALNKVNEKINIPTSKLKELKNILSRMYTALQESFEAKQQVCMFISLGMKKYSSIGVRQQKEKQSKTKIAERGPDVQCNQRNAKSTRKDVKGEKSVRGKHWLPCNYCFTYVQSLISPSSICCRAKSIQWTCK